MTIMRTRSSARTMAALTVLVFGGLACQDHDGAAPDDERAGPTPYELAGHTLAAELGCGRCHALTGGGHALEAPALIGHRPAYDEDWLRAHLVSPLDATTGVLSTVEVESRELYDEEVLALVAWSRALAAADARVIDATPEEIRGGWVFFDYVCTECHVVHGAGGKRGPDLSRAGVDHTREWLGNQILFPLDHKSDGEMPAFQGKISEGDLESLLDYLELLR